MINKPTKNFWKPKMQIKHWTFQWNLETKEQNQNVDIPWECQQNDAYYV